MKGLKVESSSSRGATRIQKRPPSPVCIGEDRAGKVQGAIPMEGRTQGSSQRPNRWIGWSHLVQDTGA